MGKVLITGLGGFIGTNLVSYLKEYDSKNLNEVIALSSVKQEDIETIFYQPGNSLKELVIPEIETVIHLGAWTPKSGRDANDIEKSNSNIIFTTELLNKLPSSLKKIIFISTIDVYGRQNDLITEKTTTLPSSLYGWSKLYCEQMVYNWAQEKEVNCQILRVGHIYGKGEDAYKKIIPVFIHNLLTNTPITITSSGLEKRSFLHVSDCVRCIWEAINIEAKENIINLVSEHPFNVKEIAEILLEISGEKGSLHVLNQNIQTVDLVFDNTLMKHYFGEERIKLHDGLLEEFIYFKDKR